MLFWININNFIVRVCFWRKYAFCFRIVFQVSRKIFHFTSPFFVFDSSILWRFFSPSRYWKYEENQNKITETMTAAAAPTTISTEYTFIRSEKINLSKWILVCVWIGWCINRKEWLSSVFVCVCLWMYWNQFIVIPFYTRLIRFIFVLYWFRICSTHVSNHQISSSYRFSSLCLPPSLLHNISFSYFSFLISFLFSYFNSATLTQVTGWGFIKWLD